MDNYCENPTPLRLRYHRLILLWLSFLSVPLSVPIPPIIGANQQTSRIARGVRHYAANLASEVLKEDIRESLKDSQLDQQIKAVHSTLTTLFQLNTNLMFVEMSDSPERAKNTAVAVESISDFFPELSAKYPDGTILLAKELVEDKFLREGLRKDTCFGQDCSAPRELSLVAVNGIMAHELAHLLQKKKRCLLRGKERELNADFLAGWALTNRVFYRYHLLDLWKKQASDVAMASSKLSDTFAKLGDDRLVSQDSYMSNPHGLGDERYRVIQSGVTLEGRDLDAAYEEGVQFVSNTPFTPIPLASLDGTFASIRQIVGSVPSKFSWDDPFLTGITVYPPNFTVNGCHMTVEQRRSSDYRINGKDYKDQFLPPYRYSAQLDSFDLTDPVRVFSVKEYRRFPWAFGTAQIPETWYVISLIPIRGPSPLGGRTGLELIVQNQETAKAATARLVSAIKVCQNNADSHLLFDSKK